jgi:hypothetical protein
MYSTDDKYENDNRRISFLVNFVCGAGEDAGERDMSERPRIILARCVSKACRAAE